MIILPPVAALMSMLLAPSTGTAAITFRVVDHTVEATLRAPRRAFANLPERAPAALVAGSCAVRADNVVLQPGTLAVPRASSDSSDSLVTAVVRYRTSGTPKNLDVSCAMFPSQTAPLPHPNLVLVMSGRDGRTALISANAEGRVDAGMRVR